jgi:hypothetical protein
VFHGLVRRFSHLRQFSPVLLRALEFLVPPTANKDWNSLTPDLLS